MPLSADGGFRSRMRRTGGGTASFTSESSIYARSSGNQSKSKHTFARRFGPDQE